MGRTQSRFAATDPVEYEHFMRRWSERLAKPFLEFASIRSGDRVIDVGCGTDVLTATRAAAGAQAAGIDASEPYLDGARRYRSDPNITCELGDVRRMRFVEGSFDACVSTLVLDIIPKLSRWLPRCSVSCGPEVWSRPECTIFGAATPPSPWCGTRDPCSTRVSARCATI
jgi:2-polyprenyl-3-methyl-5-hydroxy-6-metoxy-1,4-benzoquinol methylase